MTKKLVSQKLNINNADKFIKSIATYEDAYYVFAGKHTPYSGSSDIIVTQPTDGVKQNVISVYDDMIFGKRVQSSDVISVIPRYDWETNSVYAQYDDTDGELLTKEFYAVVNAGAQYLVYKCLYNNNGANSTVEPSGTDPNPFETPNDGYIWKYMYTANDTYMSKFATASFMPLIANTAVSANADPGSIEVIAIDPDNSGNRYDNYFSGTFTSISDIKVGGNSLIYNISPSASGLDHFYDSCIIKMTSGAAAGEYKIITNYVGSTRQITLESDTGGFVGSIAIGDTYEISPYVVVFDNGGSKQTNCIARALISSTSGNSVSKVEILNPGTGYRSATAVILAPSVITGLTGWANASLRAIISPPGGHGSNVENELGANRVCISIKFQENESGYITLDNDYRQVGLLKNPLFANLHLALDNAQQTGNFVIGEKVYSYNQTILAGNVAITTGSPTVTGTDTHFDESLDANNKILITDGTTNLFANVAAIASNTSLSLSVNANFTSASATISRLAISDVGIVTGNTSGLTLTNVSVAGISPTAYFTKLIGKDSYATGAVDVLNVLPASINGNAVNFFTTFSQLTSLVGSKQGATNFIADETVYGGDTAVVYTRSQAKFHSYLENGSDDIVYVTNVKNVFPLANSVTGDTSKAVLNISYKYDGWLVKDSGDVVYVENVDPITRASNKSETVKLILEF
jgi:hypothetical protein